jgi:hypothetical protein
MRKTRSHTITHAKHCRTVDYPKQSYTYLSRVAAHLDIHTIVLADGNVCAANVAIGTELDAVFRYGDGDCMSMTAVKIVRWCAASTVCAVQSA